MLNILVTGANGQLGRCIKDTVDGLKKISKQINNYLLVSHEDLDITDYNETEEYVEREKINVIVNCAAYTNVEKSETTEGFMSAVEVNAIALGNLSSISNKKNIFLINIGTDYIYDDICNVPLKPNQLERMNPLNKYGLTKLKGIKTIKESFVENNFNYINIVTSWLYSEYGENFVTKMFKKIKNGENIYVVKDQIGSPTYAPNLARFIVKICEGKENDKTYFDILKENKTLKENELRIIHFSDEGVASWYDLVKGIEEYSGYNLSKINPCETNQYFVTKAKRPHYSVLDLSLTKEIIPDFNIRYWRDSLKECIMNIKRKMGN